MNVANITFTSWMLLTVPLPGDWCFFVNTLYEMLKFWGLEEELRFIREFPIPIFHSILL